MDSDLLVIWGTGLALSVLVGFPFVLRMRRRERATETAQEEALRYGLHEPVSLHPIVDPERCIGTGACADVCPESVLGVRAGQAVAVRPARCIGHGLCERACPMEAIRLVFGTERRGVDLPRVREDFETNVPGLYVVGELGGMGLVANAFEQGRQCVEGIAGGKKKNRRAPAPAVRATATRAPGDDGQGDLLDLVIVGCGPAGLSASLTAMDRGLRAVTLEREDLGGAVRHYPRKKLVMTRPVKVPGYGKLPVREIHKEELIGLWEDIARRVGLEVRTGEVVTGVERIGAGGTGRARGGSGSDGGCRVGPDNGNGAPFRVTSSGGQ
ncbi:MAG TPA: 4Fe-4S dicluster domain-containing protein, partial [Longimicrobiales bacterium]